MKRQGAFLFLTMALAVFQANGQEADMFTDESRAAIEQIKGDWVYGFENLESGEGYRVKVNANVVLTISMGTKGATVFKEKEQTKPLHFTTSYTGNGLDHMNIYSAKPKGTTKLSPGDELGIFDGDICVGAVVEQESNGKYVSVTASFDDPVTLSRDGFVEGRMIDIRFWDNENRAERSLEKIEVIKGKGMVFERMGTLILKAEFEGTGELFLGDAYPNPSDEKTTFTFGLLENSQVKFEIIDLRGTPIKVLIDETDLLI